MPPRGKLRKRIQRCGVVFNRAAALTERRAASAVVFLIALAAWWCESVVIPLTGGRDLGTYLGAYVQLFQAHPIDLGYVLGRTPISSLFVGGLLDFGGGALAGAVMSLLYAASVAAWFLAGRIFGSRAALLTTLVLLAYPGYAILFHEFSSDSLFAAAFAAWAFLTARLVQMPTPGRFAAVGFGVGILALIRPGNQVLLALAVVPLLLRNPWRIRIVSAAAFVLPAVVLVGGWALHNGLRYGDYTLARGGNSGVPFFRTFVTDHIVRPSNGPASRELARAVRQDLLPKEPYRSYGITLDDFFRKASPRMEVDLLALSDRVKGWHTDYRWLRDVGVEAVRAHSGTYARGVLGSVWGLLVQAVFRDPGEAPTAKATGAPAPGVASPLGGSLPKPTEGEPIPAPHEGGVTTPDGSIYTVWTSPTEHHLVFVHPGAEARYNALHRRMEALAAKLPHHRGIPTLALRMNQASRWFPPPALWLALGLAALLFRRPRARLALALPAVAALLVIVLSALGLPAEPHYSVPVAPAFVLVAGGALFAPRRALEPGYLRDLTGLAIGLAAGLFAVLVYLSAVDGYADGAGAPHDLAVFLSAAAKVVHGASPYVFAGDRTFAYPPFLAFLVSPLHALSGSAAAILWTLFSLAFVALALWLLDVHDWRCYGLAGTFLFTRSAVDLGTVEPLLLVAVAAAWRWRERLAAAAAATGIAVVVKLFLWPLAVWLALTRRLGAAAAAVGVAAVLALATWAALGFAGMDDYPGLLRKLADHESSSSYSVVALGVRAHLPLAAARVLSVVVALALLVVAAWVARDERRAPRERDAATLILCIGAALAASPIVWVHYFLLLLVPLALTRPRLSALWLVPLAYYPLGEAAWPAGDARKLALALVVTLVILGGSLLSTLAPNWQTVLRPRARLRLASWSQIRSDA
jgi:Glycosyltransferase family 87/Dolichyl-phosphate-mannose-protein mannosyltransferase